MYVDPASDPYKITPKSYDTTRKMKTLANPMVILNATSILRDADTENYELYNEKITKLIEDIKKFYKPEWKATFESITENNEVLLDSASCRVINPGHDIECSWFLIEEAEYTGDTEMLEKAEQIVMAGDADMEEPSEIYRIEKKK